MRAWPQRQVVGKEGALVLPGHGIDGSITLEYPQHYATQVDGIILHAPVGPRAATERFLDEYRRCAVFGQLFALITPQWFTSPRPVAAPAAHQADDYRALLPRSAVRSTPGWDHDPLYEQPDEYAREIAALAAMLVGGALAEAAT